MPPCALGSGTAQCTLTPVIATMTLAPGGPLMAIPITTPAGTTQLAIVPATTPVPETTTPTQTTNTTPGIPATTPVQASLSTTTGKPSPPTIAKSQSSLSSVVPQSSFGTTSRAVQTTIPSSSATNAATSGNIETGTVSGSIVVSSATSSADASMSSNTSHGLSKGALIGIAVGITFAFIFFLVFIVLLWRWRAKKKDGLSKKAKVEAELEAKDIEIRGVETPTNRHELSAGYDVAEMDAGSDGILGIGNEKDESIVDGSRGRHELDAGSPTETTPEQPRNEENWKLGKKSEE